MACYRPIPAYQLGSEPPRLWPPLGTENLQLPCGKCIGCKAARANQWAHRCEHEASIWKDNSFITLTYADERLPKDGHLSSTDFQRFLKRLRQHSSRHRSSIGRSHSANIRYFGCGEYGERHGRPHYHALLFNCTFNDQYQTGVRHGEPVFHSDTLQKLWPNGNHEIGTVTGRSAHYIAKYNLKKQGAGNFDADGVERPAPFLRMSLKPAIGATWLEKYHEDLQHGYLVQNGHQHGLPRYYKTSLKNKYTTTHELLQKHSQQHRIQTPTDNNTTARRLDAEKIHEQKKQKQEMREF